MSTLSNAGRVGAAVVVGLLLFGGMWAFFLQASLFSRTYSIDVLFDSAGGVLPDTPVMLAGVPIGTVDTITLTPEQRADLHLKIMERLGGKPVRIPRGSQFIITTPLLGSTGVVNVIPPADSYKRPNDLIGDGATIQTGTQAGDLSSAFTQASVLIKQLTTLTRHADQLLTDPTTQNSVQATLKNINGTTASAAKLTAALNAALVKNDAKVDALLSQTSALLAQTQAGEKQVLGNVEGTTAQLDQFTKQNRAHLDETVLNLRDTTASLAGLTQQANDLLKSGGVSQNLSATVANLKTTTDKLALVAANIQSLTGDAGVQSNLKATVANLRETTEASTALLDRLNRIAGGRRRPAAVILAPGVPAIVMPPSQNPANGGTIPPLKTNSIKTDTINTERGPLYLQPRLDAVQNLRSHHFRLDADVLAPIGPGNLARLGVYGAGDDGGNKLILEGGRFVGRTGIDVRGGLYASRLGAGADAGLGRPLSASVEYYNVNRPRLDARGVLRVTPSVGIVAGGEDLTRKGKAGGIVGLQYSPTH